MIGRTRTRRRADFNQKENPVATLIILRIVHIGCGVFWAGGVLFMNFIVGPALAASGPDGVRVVQEMNRRHYFDVILAAALFTIVAGLILVRQDSAGFTPSWFRSPFGAGIGAGMIAAILAFLIGVIFIKPAMVRMSRLGAEMAQSPAEARGAFMPRLDAARGRLMAWGMVGSIFIIIAVLAMATARYL
jgi:uncharacterized membrane protein